MQEWKRAVRAVQAAMIKHGGIASLVSQYCQQQRQMPSITEEETDREKDDGKKIEENISGILKRKHTIEKLSNNDLRILSERVRVIANAIKPLTSRWMGPAAQQLKQWNYWFNFEEVDCKMENYKQKQTQHQKSQVTTQEDNNNANTNNTSQQPPSSQSQAQTISPVAPVVEQKQEMKNDGAQAKNTNNENQKKRRKTNVSNSIICIV